MTIKLSQDLINHILKALHKAAQDDAVYTKAYSDFNAAIGIAVKTSRRNKS